MYCITILDVYISSIPLHNDQSQLLFVVLFWAMTIAIHGKSPLTHYLHKLVPVLTIGPINRLTVIYIRESTHYHRLKDLNSPFIRLLWWDELNESSYSYTYSTSHSGAQSLYIFFSASASQASPCILRHGPRLVAQSWHRTSEKL